MPRLLDIDRIYPAPAIPPRGGELLSGERLSSAKIGPVADVGVEVGDAIRRPGDRFVYAPAEVWRGPDGQPTLMRVVRWELQVSQRQATTHGGLWTPADWVHCAPPT